MSKKKTTTAKRGSGSIYKRGKAGTYYVKFYADGKQVAQRLIDKDGKSITDRRKAEIAAKAFLAPMQEQTKVDQLKAVTAKLQNAEETKKAILAARKPSLPLSKVWSEYHKSQNRPKSGESTLSRYKATITAFRDWMKETYPTVTTMRKVTTEHAEGYAHHLEGKKLSPSSFNIYLNNLSTVWAVLAQKGDISVNPFAWDKTTHTGIQRKNIKAEANLRKKRALTLDEVNAVIKKAEGDYRTLLILLACTGQRLVDCVKLRWKEIDLQEGIITLIPQKTATRTGKQVFIPILPQLRQELETLMHGSRYVLPELVATYDRDRSAVTKKLRAIFTAAELTAHKQTNLRTGQAIVETGAHSLRHSFVTIARLAGIPDVVIQTITGHQSLELVDHYTAITADTIKTLSASMPAALLSNGTNEAANNKPPVPDWIKERLAGMTADNWEGIKEELIKG